MTRMPLVWCYDYVNGGWFFFFYFYYILISLIFQLFFSCCPMFDYVLPDHLLADDVVHWSQVFLPVDHVSLWLIMSSLFDIVFHCLPIVLPCFSHVWLCSSHVFLCLTMLRHLWWRGSSCFSQISLYLIMLRHCDTSGGVMVARFLMLFPVDYVSQVFLRGILMRIATILWSVWSNDCLRLPVKLTFSVPLLPVLSLFLSSVLFLSLFYCYDDLIFFLFRWC